MKIAKHIKWKLCSTIKYTLHEIQQKNTREQEKKITNETRYTEKNLHYKPNFYISILLYFLILLCFRFMWSYCTHLCAHRHTFFNCTLQWHRQICNTVFIHFLALNHNSSHLNVLYIVYWKPSTNEQSPVSKHLGRVRRKNSLLAERNFCQNEAQGGAAICPNWLGWG